MIELLYAIELIVLGALIFAVGMYVGITTYKHAQNPFSDEVDLTQTNDKDSIENKEPAADGWDYQEYDDYISKLGDDIEGVDE